NSNMLICDFYSKFKQNGFQNLWIWIDATLYSYLPFIIILISNIIILINIRWATKQRINMIGKVTTTKFIYQYTTTTNNNNSSSNHSITHYCNIFIRKRRRRRREQFPLQQRQPQSQQQQQQQLSTCCPDSSLGELYALPSHLTITQTPIIASLNSCYNSDDKHHNNNSHHHHHHNINHFNEINLRKCKHPCVTMQLKPSNRIKGITIKATNQLLPKLPTIYANEMRQLTLLLLLISCVFLMTTSPVVFIKLLYAWRIQTNLHNMILLELFDCIAEILMYTNHAINFYLYCAVGSRFRREFKNILHFNIKYQNEDSICWLATYVEKEQYSLNVNPRNL
ncbi:hypothetical protein MN116_000251, partial [Schistosoma mekongi]